MSARLPRLGIDFGGTKIAGCVLDCSGSISATRRRPAPRDSYAASLQALVGIIGELEAETATPCSIGIGMPGSISPRTGLVQNANSTWLNGQPLARDLQDLLGCPVRFANDANCFALSEAIDGAAVGARTVFGVILGTGCGGGVVIDGRIVNGPRGIGGEWGHNPLPWPTREELAISPCWCGLTGCLETWLSGPALAADHTRVTGQQLSPEAIVTAAASGVPEARSTLDRHAHRLARGLASVTNLLDPDVIVIGGGLSALPTLYDKLPKLMAHYIFADNRQVTICPPTWGPTGGMRGAAWLWDDER